MSTTAESIKEMLDREPFKPFRLIMSSGRVYEVVSPNSAMLLKSSVFVVFPDGDTWADVPFLHISSIETFSNGSRRRGRRKNE